ALVLDERFRDRLAVQLLKLRLVVKQLELARSAGHEEIDHALSLGGEVRFARGLGATIRISQLFRSRETVIEERSQSHRAKTDGAVLEKMPASLQEQWVIHGGELG